MDKILELEKTLQDAARLADELNTANNSAKFQSPHTVPLRARLNGAVDNLAAHKAWLEAHPAEEAAAK